MNLRFLSRQQKTIPTFVGIKAWMNGLLSSYPERKKVAAMPVPFRIFIGNRRGGIVAQTPPAAESAQGPRLSSRGAPFCDGGIFRYADTVEG